MKKSQSQTISILLFLSCFFVFGLSFDQLGLRFASIATMCLAVIAILYLPTKISLMVAMGFISFQGLFKVISNYHPLVHVGADMVVIFLIVKFLYIQSSRDPQNRVATAPYFALFMAHFAWIFITYFNPESLSLISSIAGSKIYVSMILLYFFGYYTVKNLKDVHQYFILFVLLTLIHTGFAIHQGIVGPSSVTSIHPRYSVQLAKYMDTAFRPFGLTNLPGGPSVYIYSSLPFFAYFIFMGRNLLLRFFLILCLPFTGLALMFCQVRSAIIKGALSLGFFVLTLVTSRIKLSFTQRAQYISASAIIVALLIYTVPQFMIMSVDSRGDNESAFDRSLSSFDVDAMSSARRGTLDRFMLYLNTVPMGAGFARVGASAGAFANLAQADKVYSDKFFFADNLFITLLIELGIPGLIIMTLLIGLILFRGFRFWRNETRQNLIPAQLAILAALFAIAIGSYGAEGIIYNPESAFFWFFAGVLMRLQSQPFGDADA